MCIYTYIYREREIDKFIHMYNWDPLGFGLRAGGFTSEGTGPCWLLGSLWVILLSPGMGGWDQERM